MTRKEFIKLLSNQKEENISVVENFEDAEEIEMGGGNACSYTPVLTTVCGHLYIVQGTQETG